MAQVAQPFQNFFIFLAIEKVIKTASRLCQLLRKARHRLVAPLGLGRQLNGMIGPLFLQRINERTQQLSHFFVDILPAPRPSVTLAPAPVFYRGVHLQDTIEECHQPLLTIYQISFGLSLSHRTLSSGTSSEVRVSRFKSLVSFLEPISQRHVHSAVLLKRRAIRVIGIS